VYSRLSGCYWQTKHVGLLDADVYGPSIPKMMNLKGPVPLNKRKILFTLLVFCLHSTALCYVLVVLFACARLVQNSCCSHQVDLQLLFTFESRLKCRLTVHMELMVNCL